MPSFSARIDDSLKDNNPIVEVPYKQPYNKFVGEYSAINSGVSEEGGLSTLTFKSVGYTQYAEQLELMRDALFHSTPSELSRINEEVFDAKGTLDSLTKDLNELQQKLPSIDLSKSQQISENNEFLTKLLQTKQQIDDLGKTLLQNYQTSNKTLKINPPAYTRVQIDTSSIKVDDILQVQNLDTSAYDQAAAVNAAAAAQLETELYNDIVPNPTYSRVTPHSAGGSEISSDYTPTGIDSSSYGTTVTGYGLGDDVNMSI